MLTANCFKTQYGFAGFSTLAFHHALPTPTRLQSKAAIFHTSDRAGESSHELARLRGVSMDVFSPKDLGFPVPSWILPDGKYLHLIMKSKWMFSNMN